MPNNIFLKNNNDATTDSLFKSRENMKKEVYASLSETYTPMVTDHLFEEQYFGRLDEDKNSVFLSEKFLKEMTSSASGFIFAQDFVREAFNELSSYFKKGLLTNKLKTSGTPYGELNPKKAFVNSNKLYTDYFNKFSRVFIEYLREQGKNKEILNFKQFVVKLLDFMAEQPGSVLLTRTAFLKSKLCDSFITGLSVALMQDQFDNDFKKLETYLKDNNYSFFIESCRRHSFKVDKNAPWIIHFDFESPASLKYLSKYGLKDKSDMLEKRFYKSYLTDMKLLQSSLKHLYSLYISNEPSVDIVVAVDNCKSPILKNFIRKQAKSMDLEYSEYEWLRMYLDMRLLEENISLRQANYKNILFDIKNILQYGDGSGSSSSMAVLKRINEVINNNIVKDKKLLEY